MCCSKGRCAELIDALPCAHTPPKANPVRRLKIETAVAGGAIILVGGLWWGDRHFEGIASVNQLQRFEGELVAPSTSGEANLLSPAVLAPQVERSGEDVSKVPPSENGKLYRASMEPLAQDFIPSHVFVGPNSNSQLTSLSQPFVDSDSIVGVNALVSKPTLVATFVPSDQFVGPGALVYRDIRDAETDSGEFFTDRPESAYPNPKREDFRDVMSLPTVD